MKPIKIHTVVIVLFVGGLLLPSCNNEATSQDSNDSPKQYKNETSDSTKTGERDTFPSIIIAEVDSMKNDIENLKKQIGESPNRTDKFDTEIKNLKETEASNKLSLLISIVLSLISLAISIIALIRASKFSKRLDKHGNDIFNLKQSSDNRFSPVPMTRQNASDDFYQLKSRLKILEEEVKELKRIKNTLDEDSAPLYTSKPQPPIIPPVVETKKGYFGQPTQADRGYFRIFFTDHNSEARFSAEEKNNIAEFKPLLDTHAELETLLHTDAAKLAVEFVGCSVQDANQATVSKPGVAKFEINRWYIIQKALVVLTKQ